MIETRQATTPVTITRPKRTKREIRDGLALAQAKRAELATKPDAKEKFALLKSFTHIDSSARTVAEVTSGVVTKDLRISSPSNPIGFQVSLRTDGTKQEIGVLNRSETKTFWSDYKPEDYQQAPRDVLDKAFTSMKLHLDLETIHKPK